MEDKDQQLALDKQDIFFPGQAFFPYSFFKQA